jgi:maltooligosyltrehalose synthase
MSSYSSLNRSTATIVQLFEWNWASVQAECPTLGQLGYKYVQVSPAAEHITGSQWWTSYQRVSSQLVSKRGNRDQFGAMVAACQSAGVGVLVDVILNHMTAGSGTGIGGTGASASASLDRAGADAVRGRLHPIRVQWHLLRL